MTKHEVGASLTQRQILVSLSGLMVGMIVAAIDQTIVATALPAIVTDLGGLNYLSWVVVGYLLTSTASTPLWGKIGDLFGRRRMFQTAVVIFLVGSLACGLAPTMLLLIVGRLIQGIGGGGLYALCFGIVGDLVPPRQRGHYIGYFAGMFAVAGVLGPLAGGVITDTIGWRWIFTINLPIGIASLIVTSLTLHLPSTRRESRIDLGGAFLLVIGVIALILASVWGGDQYAWGSPQILGLIGAGLAVLVVFVIWETRAGEPILPLRLFRNKVVAVLFGLSFLLGPIYYAAASFVPLFMEAVKGYSATQAGLMLAPNAAGVSLAAIVTGRLTTRTGRYKHFVIIGNTLLIVAMIALSRLTIGWNTWFIAGLMLLGGIALGNVFPVLSTASQNAVEFTDLGVVTAAVTFFRTLGGTFGIAALTVVLRSQLDSKLVAIAATTTLPDGVSAKTLADRPAAIQALAEPLRGLVQVALTHAVAAVFLACIPLTLVVFGIGWLLEELPLRNSTTLNAARPAGGEGDAPADVEPVIAH